MKDLYSALGISRSASAKELQNAYRKLARKFHPDLNKNNKAAEARFKEISSAYDVLSDPERRKLYDEFGDQSLQAGFNKEQAEMLRKFGASGFGTGGFKSGGARARERFQRAAAAGDYSNEEFSGLGGMFEDLLNSMGGRSARAGAFQSGSVNPERAEHRQKIDVSFRDAVLGNKIDIVVGAGARSKTLKVTIPPGSKDGSKIRLSGAKSGLGIDLVLELDVKADPLFSREGDNLILELPVKLSELVNGANVQIPTLSGRVSLKIPEQSSAGSVLRMRGKGVKTGSGYGDLLVKLKLVSPDIVNPEVRELASKLDRFYARDPRNDLGK